jgi:hypothetical protein
MSKKPPRSHHKRDAWDCAKKPPSRRTSLRSIGFTEAQCGRTERELVSYHKSGRLFVGGIQQVIPKGNSRKALIVRTLLQEGNFSLAAKFTRPVH